MTLSVKENTVGSETWEKLEAEARRVARNAHAPYSKFQVGSALLGVDGKIYAGCNVENASYGATSCAERTSIGTAVAVGARKFVAIAIYNSSDRAVAPCGICRQVLAEFCNDLPMLLVCEGDERIVTTLDEMLPIRFSSDAL